MTFGKTQSRKTSANYGHASLAEASASHLLSQGGGGGGVQLLSCVWLFGLCGLQHTRILCPSPSPGVCSNSGPLSRWCHSTLSSSVIPFFCLQSFPASGSFKMSGLFASCGQSIGASHSSVLPMSIQGWFPLELTDLISLLSKGLSRILSSTTV